MNEAIKQALEALTELADVAERCDSWQSFPSEPLEKGRAAIASLQPLLADGQAVPSDEAEFELHDADGNPAASTFGHRAAAWAEMQHYAAQYRQDGPVTIYEVRRIPVSDGQAVQWPAGLLERVKAAEQRIADNHAPRRIPADPHGDVDLVLAEVRYLIEGNWPPFWIKAVPTVQGVAPSGHGNLVICVPHGVWDCPRCAPTVQGVADAAGVAIPRGGEQQ